MLPPCSRFARFAVASLLAACGARTGLDTPGDGGTPATDGAESAVAFPVGEYTGCAFGIYSTSGGLMGVDHGAVLSLTQRGATLHARYVDQNDARSEFDFAPTTGATATLVPGGAAVAGAPHACVRGVGSVLREPTALLADEGALVVDQNAVFLVAQGTAADVTAGPCGVLSDRQSVWIACARRDRVTPAASAGASTAAFPTGTFACQTQMATYTLAGSTNEYAADGAMGSLTVTQRGGALSLSYTGDRSASAAADFALTSSTTARVRGASGFNLVCDVPISTPAATSVAPMDAAAGALLLVGTTLFVSVAGTMRGPCEGAEKFVTLRCTRR
jgi:hypothetical protein